MLGAGVIGAGMISSAHCDGYKSCINANLLAISDVMEERLKESAKKYNITGYSDYEKLLKRDDIDIVSVCTPDHTHFKVALDAINAGKHVIVEKPMALTIEECDELLAASKRNNVQITTSFTYRYNPVFYNMKTRIDDNELGKVVATSIFYLRRLFRPKPGGWIQKSQFTNMFSQESVHYLDILRWFGGDVESVNAISNRAREDYTYDQVIFANLKFKDGAIGELSHTILGFQFRHLVWLIGTKESVCGELIFSANEGSYGSLRIKERKEDIMEDAKEEFIKTINYGHAEVDDDAIISRLVKDTVDRITEKQPLRITGVDAKKAIELCIALESSSFYNKTIDLPLKSTPECVLKRLGRPGLQH